MRLSKFQKKCYKIFGQFSEKRVNKKLKNDLKSARIEIRAGAYFASSIFISIIGFFATLILVLLFLFLLHLVGASITGIMVIFLFLIPIVIGLLILGILVINPRSQAKAHAKRIDENLPYALNFISAMTSAGVIPTEIFRSLSKQKTYGEIKEEASFIYRDVAVFGNDILTAIRSNIERTPSNKFKEFLQGLVVTVTSGGSLKSYFMTKAEQYTMEKRQEQKQLIENLGIMAESYVTTAVAGILLLLIIIPLMMVISGDWNGMFLAILIFMLVPLIHGGFSYVIKTMW